MFAETNICHQRKFDERKPYVARGLRCWDIDVGFYAKIEELHRIDELPIN